MPVPGDRIQDLLIEAEIGRGAFATVYRAQDTLIGRTVALKVLHDAGAQGANDAARLMLREARLVGGLASPHVVTLYRVHVMDGNDFMFEMEYVDGCSLEERLAQSNLRADEAQHVISGVLGALVAAHEASVVHRDIKPGNVLLRQDGGVKLADFGLGRLLTDERISSQSTADAAGTPAYMAPEVFTGSRPSPASDIWSMGILIFRVLTGRLPYDAKNLPELFIALSTKEPERLSDDIPVALRNACDLCLRRDPNGRGTAKEVLAILTARVQPVAPLVQPIRAQDATTDDPIGREAETARFESVLRVVDGGASKLALLSGGVGAGKTSLLQHVRERARSMGMQWVDVAISPVGGLLRPLLKGLRHSLAIDRSQDADLIITSERFGDAAAFLRSLLSSEVGDVEDRQRLVWAIEHLVREMARTTPLAIALDDMHLANTEDMRLLLDLARNLTDSPALLVAALRPWDMEESAESAPGMLQVLHELHTTPTLEHIELEPLNESSIYEILSREAGGMSIEGRAADVIVRKAEGNPLYAIEMFRDLRATGDITESDDLLKLRSGWDASNLPRRFRDLVARRLGGLGDDDRMLVDVAAVDGVEFDGPALCAVLEQPLLRVLQTLQRLHRQHGLVQPAVTGFRFSHILYRDTIYNEIAPELQKEIHRLLAEHLSAREDKASVDPQRLGMHWHYAGLADKARPFLLRAASDAMRRGENLRAMELIAIGLPAELDPAFTLKHADLLVAVAGARADLGQRDQALLVMTDLLQAAEALDDEQLHLRALVLKNDLEYWSGGGSRLDPKQLEHASEHLAVGREKGLAYHCLAREALSVRDDLEAAQVWIDRADAVYQQASLHTMHASALDYKASIAWGRGDSDLSALLYAQAAEISNTHGRRINAAISDVNRATLDYDRGRHENLARDLRRAVLVLSRHGSHNSAAHTTVHLARLLHSRGQSAQALETLDEALRLLSRTRGSGASTYALTEQAAVLGAGPDVAATKACIARIQEVAADTGFGAAMLRAHIHRALLDDVLGERDQDAVEAAFVAGQEIREPPRRADMCARLAEGVLLGGRIAWVPRLRALLSEHETEEEVPGVLDAAEALTDHNADAALLQRAADGLRAGNFGDRRAERAALGHWLEAEALARAGEENRALPLVARALQDAERAGSVWVELAVLRAWLARLPNESWSTRRETLLARIGQHLPDDAARARLRMRWG